MPVTNGHGPLALDWAVPQGASSTSSMAPAATTFGSCGSMAMAPSADLFTGNGVSGLAMLIRTPVLGENADADPTPASASTDTEPSKPISLSLIDPSILPTLNLPPQQQDSPARNRQ